MIKTINSHVFELDKFHTFPEKFSGAIFTFYNHKKQTLVCLLHFRMFSISSVVTAPRPLRSKISLNV